MIERIKTRLSDLNQNSDRGTGGKKLSVEMSSIILICLLGIIAFVTDKTFVAGSNLINMADAIVILLMIGLGVTFVIMAGADHLAIGGMLSLNCVLFALFSHKFGLWAILLVILCGLLEGLLTGIVYTSLKIPSFIATFGMMGILTSFAVLISQGAPIVINMDVLKSLNKLDYMILPGIKIQYILTLIIFLIFLFIQYRTRFGKNVIAIGGSPVAARHMGININLIKWTSFGLSGISNALGAIFLCSKLYAGDPTVGTNYLLLVLAVIVVGGTSMSGGVGGVFNTLLGATTIAILQNAMHIMGVNIYYHPVVIGVVLIIAVAISLDKEKILVVK